MSETLCDRCNQPLNATGLVDTLGKPICCGNIVHWTDGGDDLSLEERIATRWDRIAVVSMEGILPQFHVIDSPSKSVMEYARAGRMRFNYGSFMYEDTQNHLTVVADDEAAYAAKFANAGECMAWVLEKRGLTQAP